MTWKSKLNRLFIVLARCVGALWILGGFGLLVSAAVERELRGAYLIFGMLFFAAGIGLLVAKPRISAAE